MVAILFCRRWIVCIGCWLAALPAAAALQEGQPPPFVGTPLRVVERMLTMAKLTAADTLIDLGSGDGRIVIEAAKRVGARALGIEMSPELVASSRRSAQREGVADRVRFLQQDAFSADLSQATVLTLYLSPEFNERLMPRILQTMRPGARVVSHDFVMGTWTPDAMERFEVPEKNNGRGGESSIMLWVVPAQAAGRWRASIGTDGSLGKIEFSIAQQFQFIEAALHSGSGSRRFVSATLAADRIRLQLPAASSSAQTRTVFARVDGDTMRGSLGLGPDDPGAVPFAAHRIRTRPDLF